MRQKREEIVLSNSINLNELSKEQIECLETVGISTKDNMHYIEGRPLTYIPSADYMRVLIYDGNNFLFERYDTNSGSGIAIPSSLANPKAKISINEGNLSYWNNTIRRNILVDLDFNSFGNKIKFSSGIKSMITLEICSDNERQILNDVTEFLKQLNIMKRL